MDEIEMTSERASQIALIYLKIDGKNFSIDQKIINGIISTSEEACLNFLLNLIKENFPKIVLFSELEDRLENEEEAIQMAESLEISLEEFQDFIKYLYISI